MGLGRVELPTRSLGNCCSIHLSYSPGELGNYRMLFYSEWGREVRTRRVAAGTCSAECRDRGPNRGKECR